MLRALLPLAALTIAAAADPVLVGSGDHVYEVDAGWAKLPADVRLGYTHAVAIDRAGDVHVFNESAHAVAVFAPDGTFRRSWGAALHPGAHGMTLAEEDGREVLWLAI